MKQRALVFNGPLLIWQEVVKLQQKAGSKILLCNICYFL